MTDSPLNSPGTHSHPMFAAINIHKPPGMTSHDVVARLRRIFGLKKIGHLGTLDPLAEGVLPACLGQATRLIEYFPDDKRYRAEITLGRTTTTLDNEGEMLTETDCSGLDLSEARLQEVLARFTGTIMQQVPLYSAVHVGGKKLYELARQGKTADLPTRETTIHELPLLETNLADPAHPILTLDVHCSSGTYIRSLARDIGDALGCGAYLSHLTRTRHGRFDIADSVSLETLQKSENPAGFLLDPVPYLAIPVLPLVSEEEARLLSNGMRIEPPVTDEGPVAVRLKSNETFLATYRQKPIGVVTVDRHRLKPVKIFHLSENG
jgi:tRNA pseudouridine55 synthase